MASGRPASSGVHGSGSDHRPFLAVRAIIPDADGRVLLLRRAPGTMAAGRWCLPGGKVDFGETAEATVAKEIHEETGLVCESSRFLSYQDSLPGPDTPMHFVNLYFECRSSGTVVLNRESSQFAWAKRDELAGMALAFGNDEGLRRYWA